MAPCGTKQSHVSTGPVTRKPHKLHGVDDAHWRRQSTPTAQLWCFSADFGEGQCVCIPSSGRRNYAPSVAPTSSYGAVSQPYGASPMPYQTTNSTSCPQTNTVPQNHAHQVYQQSGYTQTSSSAYLVSTTSIQPSPNSGYNISTTAPTSTPGRAAPSVNYPPSNYGLQYPTQYNAAVSGAPTSQQPASYVQASTEQQQHSGDSADNGKGVQSRIV